MVVKSAEDHFYLIGFVAVSYTHLRAHETVLDLVCRLLLEKKKKRNQQAMDLLIHINIVKLNNIE